MAACGKARRASGAKKWRRMLANDDAMTVRVLPPREEEMNNDRQTVTIRVRLSASGSIIDYDSHPRSDRSETRESGTRPDHSSSACSTPVDPLPLELRLRNYEHCEYSSTIARLLTQSVAMLVKFEVEPREILL